MGTFQVADVCRLDQHHGGEVCFPIGKTVFVLGGMGFSSSKCGVRRDIKPLEFLLHFLQLQLGERRFSNDFGKVVVFALCRSPFRFKGVRAASPGRGGLPVPIFKACCFIVCQCPAHQIGHGTGVSQFVVQRREVIVTDFIVPQQDEACRRLPLIVGDSAFNVFLLKTPE